MSRQGISMSRQRIVMTGSLCVTTEYFMSRQRLVTTGGFYVMTGYLYVSTENCRK